MEVVETVHLVIRCVFITCGICYLQHFLLKARHYLLPILPALMTVLSGIIYNTFILMDILELQPSQPSFSKPFSYQHQRFTEVLITLIIGGYLLKGVSDPALKITQFWKINAGLLVIATNLYMFICYVKTISTSIVIKEDGDYLIHTDVSKNGPVMIYMCIILPQYISVVSVCWALNEEESTLQLTEKFKEVNEIAENDRCEICSRLSFYYQLNLIYMGIVIIFIKPFCYFFHTVGTTDPTNEYLIVPPYVAIITVFLFQKIRLIRQRKETVIFKIDKIDLLP